jgi:hypothetical protein
MLRNIRPAKTTMDINCNAGVTRTKQIGDLPGYGEVWFNPKGIANILSLAKVEEQHRVTYDSADGQGFTVHKGDGVTRQFKKSKRGLFYLNVTERTGTALVNKVADNQNRYTVRSYKQAELARKIQNMLGRPSTWNYLRIIDGNLLKDCPVTRQDVVAAEDIFGPNLGSLKGKTVRRSERHVKTARHDLPPYIMEQYRDVTLCADIMFVNEVPNSPPLKR